MTQTVGKVRSVIFIVAILAMTSACWAQGSREWELGALGGYGFQTGLTAQTSTFQADTGFQPNGAAGAVITDDMHGRISGEIRYLYRWGDLRVQSGGQQAVFSGRSHIVHYDFLYHFAGRESKIRPFVAGGAGIKYVQGTGSEMAFQPLSQFVLLTKTSQVLPLISVGGGVRWSLTKRWSFRAEVRDYITPAPKDVLAPSPGSSIHGWLHDVIPLGGFSYRF